MLVKRLLFILAIILIAGNVFGADTAQQVDFLLSGIEKDGDPCSGCKVYTYQAGTTTAKATYLDRNKAGEATNPIILDSEGRAEVFADGTYKFVIKESDDTAYFDIDAVSYGEGSIAFTTLSAYDDLEDAINDIGSTETVLVIDTTTVLNNNLTIPTNVTLHVFEYDSVDLNGKTLTMNGTIQAPAIEWIIGGSGTFTGSPIVSYYDPIWTKSTITDSATPTYSTLSLTASSIAGGPTISGGATIINATLSGQPIISDFTNSTHTHITNATGGPLDLALKNRFTNLTVTVTTGNRDALVTYGETVMHDSSNNAKLFRGGSFTIDITDSGVVNGLESGSSLLANTWYFIWAIGNTSGVQGGLFSRSTTNPTLPSGYTYRSLASAVRTDGSSNFVGFNQQDDRVSFLRVGTTTITGTSYSEYSVSTYIPPSLVKSVSGNLAITPATIGNAAFIAHNNSGFGETEVNGLNTSNVTVIEYDVTFLGAQSAVSAFKTNASDTASFDINGYIFR